jgi:hypothetical protein
MLIISQQVSSATERVKLTYCLNVLHMLLLD